MSWQELHGKKRSSIGTALYVIAIILKVISILMCYLIITENSSFMLYFGIASTWEDQSISTLYWGSMIMALQCGILLYSLTHDDYRLGKKDSRPWIKALVFLYSPIHLFLILFKDRMYNVMGWEYGLMVILDTLIFIGCISRTGSSMANNLRPFKDVKVRRDVEEGDRHEDAPRRERNEDAAPRREKEKTVKLQSTDSADDERPSPPPPRPKIRVDQLSDEN